MPFCVFQGGFSSVNNILIGAPRVIFQIFNRMGPSLFQTLLLYGLDTYNGIPESGVTHCRIHANYRIPTYMLHFSNPMTLTFVHTKRDCGPKMGHRT